MIQILVNNLLNILSVDPSCTASSECISGEGCNSAGDCGTCIRQLCS